jgi:hypothetical protein
MGGTLDRIYSVYYYNNRIYALNPDTLTQISSATGPQSNPRRVGGIRERLYLMDNTSSTNRIHELHFVSLAAIRYVSVANAEGVGGTDTQLYCAKPSVEELHELNPNTLASISQVDAPAASISNIGGTFDRLYCARSTSATEGTLYELSPIDMTVLVAGDAPDTNMRGIGGLKQTDGPMLIINSMLESMQGPAAINYLGDIYRK